MPSLRGPARSKHRQATYGLRSAIDGTRPYGRPTKWSDASQIGAVLEGDRLGVRLLAGRSATHANGATMPQERGDGVGNRDRGLGAVHRQRADGERFAFAAHQPQMIGGVARRPCRNGSCRHHAFFQVRADYPQRLRVEGSDDGNVVRPRRRIGKVETGDDGEQRTDGCGNAPALPKAHGPEHARRLLCLIQGKVLTADSRRRETYQRGDRFATARAVLMAPALAFTPGAHSLAATLRPFKGSGEATMPWWGWLIMGAVLAGVELTAADLAFYFIFLGVSAIVVGLAELAGADLPLWGQWLAFAGISLSSMVLFRKRVYEKLKGDAPGFDSTPAGEVVEVTEAVGVGERTRVQLRGSEWNATNVGAAPIPAGSSARVVGPRGAGLEIESLAQLDQQQGG
ncbi:MAG: NfeD family protein [Gammaproteobacteria bacterium]|nr:NfeD family protein [Gammaproteobacteria bacterium]